MVHGYTGLIFEVIFGISLRKGLHGGVITLKFGLTASRMSITGVLAIEALTLAN